MCEDVPVWFELYRPSDGAVSEPKAFRYKPSHEAWLGERGRKIPRRNTSSSQPSPVQPQQVATEFSLQPVSVNQTNLNLDVILDNLINDPR